MEPECTATDTEDGEAKFRKTLRQIITLAPVVQCPQEQQVMHEWIERFMEPTCADDDEARRLEYSRYLLFQLKRGKLHVPFLESPCKGSLKPLDEMLGIRDDEEEDDDEAEAKAQSSRHSVERRSSLSQERKKSMEEKKVKYKVSKAEEQRMKLLNMLKCFTPENITLENFIIAVGPHTKDKGKLMTEITTQEQITYKRQIETIYREKEQKIADELAREQAGIPKKYQLAKQRMLSRAMAGLNYIKSQLPGFQYDRWAENPDYVREQFERIKQKEAKQAALAGGPGATQTGGLQKQDTSLDEWERQTLQMLHDVNYESERIEEANTDKEKEIQELRAQSDALEQDFACKKAKLVAQIQEFESEKFGFAIANDERDRVIEHLLQDLQNLSAQKALEGDEFDCMARGTKR